MKRFLALVGAWLLLFSGCAGFRQARSFPSEFQVTALFSAPVESQVKEVRFAPDHRRFLVFMQNMDGRFEMAGEASGRFDWAGYSSESPDGDSDPFFKAGGVSFVIKNADGYRLFHRGLSGAPFDEISSIRHTASGAAYAARNREGWFLVQAIPGEGRLFEEALGPFAGKPVFAADEGFFVTVEPGPVVRLEGPTFSIPFPLSVMQENLGLSIGVPDLIAAASGDGIFAVALGSSSALPGAVNAFVITVREDQENQAGFSPFPGFDRMTGPPVISADASRAAFVAEKEGKARLVVADLKKPSFGIGPGFEGIAHPVFSPKNAEGACVVSLNGKFQLLRGEKAESGLFDFMAHPVFSADGDHLAVIAKRGGKWFVVLDGVEHGPVDCDSLENPAFTEGGKSLLLNAVIGRHLYMVTLQGGGK
ncbi:MAG: hypothetical protein HZB23_09760 [Deltaproteobacteria bacterium]|nr:hypothetical protein [Deltaproteobacteria bacterium]